MGKAIFVVALTLACAGLAFGYTYSHPLLYGMWVYDGLATYDHGGMPLTPNALHFNVGVGYLMASEGFDEDGDTGDLGADLSVIGVPIDVGYAFDERILVDVTLQVLSTSYSWEGEDWSAAGLGDVWVKGRYIAPVDSFNLGGRLGVKIPVGKVDYAWDADPPLGDDQMDIDVAAVGSTYPDEGFAFNGQFGFRYRMPADIGDEGETFELTPGMMIYFDLNPGYTMGPENFQIYVPIGYFMTTDWKVDGETAEDSAENGLYVGVAPKYGIDANNVLGLKFLYPIMGTNTLKSTLIGLTYEGYLPM